MQRLLNPMKKRSLHRCLSQNTRLASSKIHMLHETTRLKVEWLQLKTKKTKREQFPKTGPDWWQKNSCKNEKNQAPRSLQAEREKQVREGEKRGERDGGKKKGRVVFHELWISEAALSAHRHQLTRREGKGQQHTSNRGGTEWGEKERNSQRIFNLICDWWVFKIRENLTEFARYVMKFCFFFFLEELNSFCSYSETSFAVFLSPCFFFSLCTYGSRFFFFFLLNPSSYHFSWICIINKTSHLSIRLVAGIPCCIMWSLQEAKRWDCERVVGDRSPVWWSPAGWTHPLAFWKYSGHRWKSCVQHQQVCWVFQEDRQNKKYDKSYPSDWFCMNVCMQAKTWRSKDPKWFHTCTSSTFVSRVFGWFLHVKPWFEKCIFAWIQREQLLLILGLGRGGRIHVTPWRLCGELPAWKSGLTDRRGGLA